MARDPKLPLQTPTRWAYLVVAVAILLILVLGWRGREPLSLARPDEYIYLALSESLESGSYRDIYLDGAPFHVKYPPAYPAWLVLVRKIGGGHHDMIRGANLLLIAAFALCLFGIIRRLAGIPLACAAILLVALNPTLLEAGGSLLSEALFLALVGGSLLCAVRSGPNEGRNVAGAIGFAIAAFLTRTAGIALLLALGVWLWQRRRPRELLGFALAALIAVGGWFSYAALAPQTGDGGSYGVDIAKGLGTADPGILARLAWQFWLKTSSYLSDGLPWSLALPTVGGTKLDNVAWLAVMIVSLVGGLVLFWRKSRAVFGYLVFAGILIALWPWRVDRLLIPLVPFLIAAMLIGMHLLTGKLAPPWRTLVPGGLAVLMGVGAARSTLARDAMMSRCDREDPYRTTGCYARLGLTLAQASEHLRVNAPAGTVVLTHSPPEIHYLSGHRTIPAGLIVGLPEGGAAQVLSSRNARYALITEPAGYQRRAVAPALLASCRELRVEKRFDNGGLLLFLGTPRTPSEDGCAALSHLVSAGSGVSP